MRKYDMNWNLIKDTLSFLVAIFSIIFGLVGSCVSIQTLKISEYKYEQENRPYIYLEKISWNGEYEDLLEFSIKNPSNFPAKYSLSLTAKDPDGNIIFEEKSYDEEKISYPDQVDSYLIGYREINLRNKNTERTIVLKRKGVEDMLNLFSEGKKIRLTVTLDYSQLIEGSKHYIFSREYFIQQEDGGPEIQGGKIKAD